jgi:dienelactone hydrolase
MADTFPSEEHDASIAIPADGAKLQGELNIPAGARGLVLFAHGSGSSRHSPRNRYVASALREGGLATLLMDLLTLEEEDIDLQTRQLRFDIELLAERLVAAADWLGAQPETGGLKLGYFGASTGAGAALVAAARRPDEIGAVVSRGGRPDLARSSLAAVRAPTLLIVGGDDLPVIEMNREALDALRVEKQLEIVPGATHLFEEPGTLEQVARLARAWFARHLGQAAPHETRRGNRTGG